jgi:hypothetical protein
MLETWDWYMDRFFDHKVRDYLETCMTRPVVTQHGPVCYAENKTIADISKAITMSPKRVLACLQRLKRKKQVVQMREEWKAQDKRLTP